LPRTATSISRAWGTAASTTTFRSKLAASWIAKLLHRFKWIGYLGLAIVLYVAGHMVWEGARMVFIDLNRDDVSAVQGFADRKELYFPNAALRADLIVSLAKMKTHHWAGATLSMKNYFGLVPGSVYGWPKNELHYIGIPKAIVELSRVFHRSFAIVDGIIGMEGNGPIQGTPKPVGVMA